MYFYVFLCVLYAYVFKTLKENAQCHINQHRLLISVFLYLKFPYFPFALKERHTSFHFRKKPDTDDSN